MLFIFKNSKTCSIQIFCQSQGYVIRLYLRMRKCTKLLVVLISFKFKFDFQVIYLIKILPPTKISSIQMCSHSPLLLLISFSFFHQLILISVACQSLLLSIENSLWWNRVGIPRRQNRVTLVTLLLSRSKGCNRKLRKIRWIRTSNPLLLN